MTTGPAQTAPERDEQRDGARLKRGELFLIFLKTGLAFGGGLGILAVLEDELVTRRRVVSRESSLPPTASVASYPAGR